MNVEDTEKKVSNFATTVASVCGAIVAVVSVYHLFIKPRPVRPRQR
jgi:hypothetical protein